MNSFKEFLSKADKYSALQMVPSASTTKIVSSSLSTRSYSKKLILIKELPPTNTLILRRQFHTLLKQFLLQNRRSSWPLIWIWTDIQDDTWFHSFTHGNGALVRLKELIPLEVQVSQRYQEIKYYFKYSCL